MLTHPRAEIVSSQNYPFIPFPGGFMKISKLIIFVSAFVSLTAFAAPKVGDQVEMVGTYTENSKVLGVSFLQKITAYNANTDVYTVEQVQTVDTEVRTNTLNVSGDQMLSEEAAATIVENCEMLGKKETVRVPAGTYSSCHVDSGAQVWIAPVPFGTVRIKTGAGGGILLLELKSIVRGQ